MSADDDLRQRVLELYKPPFQFIHGYIQDADHRMVADQHDGPDSLRVRGWGRISYMDNPEKLQDAVGTMIAEALTEKWQGAKRHELTVWFGSMPESNGKSNFTALLLRKGESLYDGSVITLDRSEYEDRVRYEADRVRHLIGELEDEPDILAYDADKHSGYKAPPPRVPELNPADLKIDTFQVGPHGGWNTRVASGVRVKHRPSGISVECFSERSQHANCAEAKRKLELLVAYAAQIGEEMIHDHGA